MSYCNTDLFVVKNTKLQADHGLRSIQQSSIGVQLPPIHQISLKGGHFINVSATFPKTNSTLSFVWEPAHRDRVCHEHDGYDHQEA